MPFIQSDVVGLAGAVTQRVPRTGVATGKCFTSGEPAGGGTGLVAASRGVPRKAFVRCHGETIEEHHVPPESVESGVVS